jgi:hypothetical protein
MSDQIPSAPTPPASPYVPPTPGAGPKQGLSLTSFILGLAGLVFSWVPILGFLASVAAVVIGFIAKAKEPAAPKWMWLVGIIAGFVAVVISLIVLIGFIALIAIGNSVRYSY